MPGSPPRRAIGGGDPWEGRGDGSAVISWAPASCSEDWPGPEMPFRTEGPSRAPRRVTPRGGRPEELPPTQLGAASVHRRCQAQPWAQGAGGAVSTRGRTPVMSPPKLYPAVRVLALCEASVPWCRGRKETQEVLSCPRPVSPLAVCPQQTQPPAQALQGPWGPALGPASSMRPPHSLGPHVPLTRLWHAPGPGPCTRSHLGSAVPDDCQQLAGPKAQLQSLSWGRGSGRSSSQGGHGRGNSPRDGLGMPVSGHGQTPTPHQEHQSAAAVRGLVPGSSRTTADGQTALVALRAGTLGPHARLQPQAGSQHPTRGQRPRTERAER